MQILATIILIFCLAMPLILLVTLQSFLDKRHDFQLNRASIRKIFLWLAGLILLLLASLFIPGFLKSLALFLPISMLLALVFLLTMKTVRAQQKISIRRGNSLIKTTSMKADLIRLSGFTLFILLAISGLGALLFFVWAIVPHSLNIP